VCSTSNFVCSTSDTGRQRSKSPILGGRAAVGRESTKNEMRDILKYQGALMEIYRDDERKKAMEARLNRLVRLGVTSCMQSVSRKPTGALLSSSKNYGSPGNARAGNLRLPSRCRHLFRLLTGQQCVFLVDTQKVQPSRHTPRNAHQRKPGCGHGDSSKRARCR